MLNNFLKPLFSDLKAFLLDTLFPIACLGCGKYGKFLCDQCASTLINVNQICIICKKPSPSGLTHPKCFSPHAPDQLISFFDYSDELVQKLIIRGKYYFMPGVFKELGNIIAQKFSEEFPSVLKANTYNLKPSLCPIPLNPWRERWRGFNQSKILCEAMSKELNLPVIEALIRNKITRTQKDLKKEDRIKNIESAFILSPIFKSFNIQSCNFILIDDVTTTGSTLLEATKVLKRNGIENVICMTIARD